MKTCILLSLLICLFTYSNTFADPLDDLLSEFDKQYEAIKPPSEYSSINTDYKLGQTALGTLYTTKAIALLYKQNQKLIEKYDEMLRKYDEIIRQNKEIIRILSAIAKKGEDEADLEGK